MSLYLEIPKWSEVFPLIIFENEGEIIVPPHWHKEIEIIYVTKGSVNIGYNDQIVQVHEGELFVFGSGEAHYFMASPGSNRLVYQFDLNLFRDKTFKEKSHLEIIKLFEKAENHSVYWPLETKEKVIAYLKESFTEMAEQQPGYEHVVIGNLLKLMALYYREIPQKPEMYQQVTFSEAVNNQETLERLNDVFMYIETHYNEVVTLEEVAAVIGFSPFYFSRFFKKNTGQTLMQFLTDYRINQAKYILSHEKIPMIEVAEKSGFNSVKTFHHVFKEQVGMSPLKYQKAIFGNI
ncbi:helix-turn-helix transcriptional regulator [Vagococcus sp. DIV0080]|uniref:Helix-turn-helix transcriptional regulator n=1 Tax=Candidatus Vagococcus giribetii TaxID=2230876 RepID=A0ABS3HRN0_9ENTE|nr:AraC family transcriptional regulator [Vagococcus sp. DIV0080]MBO0476412.1 helix-turn-helix transcriptional regulator [Vagococcus sp. DIV0080]